MKAASQAPAATAAQPSEVVAIRTPAELINILGSIADGTVKTFGHSDYLSLQASLRRGAEEGTLNDKSLSQLVPFALKAAAAINAVDAAAPHAEQRTSGIVSRTKQTNDIASALCLGMQHVGEVIATGKATQLLTQSKWLGVAGEVIKNVSLLATKVDSRRDGGTEAMRWNNANLYTIFNRLGGEL